MGEHQLYTLNQAAEATGLTVDALRQRIKRGKLRSVRGNDGRVMLRLDGADLGALKVAPSDQSPTSRPRSRPGGQDDATRWLEGEVSVLRDALDRERGRVDQQQTELVELRVELATRQTRGERMEADLAAARGQGEEGRPEPDLGDARQHDREVLVEREPLRHLGPELLAQRGQVGDAHGDHEFPIGRSPY